MSEAALSRPAAIAPPSPVRRLAEAGLRASGPLVLLCALIFLWHQSTIYFEIPRYIVPGPFDVVRALGRMWENGLLVSNAVLTFSIAAGAYVIATTLAIATGVLIAEFRVLERLLYPYFAALQATPKVAVAPLVLIWFGFGFESKLVLAAMLSFFPMLVNTIQGLKSVDELRLRLLRSLNATPLQTLWLLKLPNALPYILVGYELAAIYAMLGVIVGEFVGAGRGIGAYLMVLNSQLDTAGSFAIVALLAAYGVSAQMFFRLLRRRLIAWAQVAAQNTREH